MLSERRYRIFARALWVEMLELWDRARVPQWRLPVSIIHERMLTYFAQQLWQAWAADDSSKLGAVLIEILMAASGEDAVEGWAPPVLCYGAELFQPL